MDTAPTIPEALLLLAIDDETGKPLLDDTTLAQSLAAAGLAELVLCDRLRLDDGAADEDASERRFVAGPGVAEERLAPLAEHAEGTTPQQAIEAIVAWGQRSAPAQVLRTALLDELTAEGVLAHEQRRWLGITWAERWQRGDRTDIEDGVQRRARSLLVGTTPVPARDDERVASAIVILHAAETLPAVFPDLDAAELDRRADLLAADAWTNEAVRGAIQGVKDAMSTVILTTVILPAATSGS